jgi:hypothetical protein
MANVHMEAARSEGEDRECSRSRSRARTLLTELPDVLIQDPVRHTAYLVPAPELARHEVTPEVWPMIDGGTVTFVIPGGEAVEEMPPFRQSPDLEPSVLIQHQAAARAYYLTFDELQNYRCEEPTAGKGYGISFVIPNSTELIEELPALRAAVLQTQESGVGSPGQVH